MLAGKMNHTHLVIHLDACHRKRPVLLCHAKWRVSTIRVLWPERLELGSEPAQEGLEAVLDGFPFREGLLIAHIGILILTRITLW